MKYGWLIYDSVGLEKNIWFSSHLIECAKKENIKLELVSAENIKFGTKNNSVFIHANEAELPDFAIVRTIFPLLSQTLEKCGVRTFNSSSVSDICNDKRKTQLTCAYLDIPTPDTLFFDKRFSFPSVSYPQILKSASGHGGSEVFYINSDSELSENLSKIPQNEYLLQIPQTPGKDMRVYAIKNTVICAALRTSNNSFKSNFTSGGNAEIVTPSNEIIKYVKKITEYLGSDLVGVDFILSSDGSPLLNEIEDVVGTRMIYSLTDIDICSLYIKHIKENI